MTQKPKKKFQKRFFMENLLIRKFKIWKLRMSKFSIKNRFLNFFLVFRSFFIILDDNKQFPGKKFFFHFFEKISLVPPYDFWARDDLPMVVSFYRYVFLTYGFFYFVRKCLADISVKKIFFPLWELFFLWSFWWKNPWFFLNDHDNKQV